MQQEARAGAERRVGRGHEGREGGAHGGDAAHGVAHLGGEVPGESAGRACPRSRRTAVTTGSTTDLSLHPPTSIPPWRQSRRRSPGQPLLSRTSRRAVNWSRAVPSGHGARAGGRPSPTGPPRVHLRASGRAAAAPPGDSATHPRRPHARARGGRRRQEHALVHSFAQSPPRRAHLLRARATPAPPRSPTTSGSAPTTSPALLEFASREEVDLTVVGPEAPLVLGIADVCRGAWAARCSGPSQAAAQLEGSKVFAKEMMGAGGVATGAYSSATRPPPPQRRISSGRATRW